MGRVIALRSEMECQYSNQELECSRWQSVSSQKISYGKSRDRDCDGDAFLLRLLIFFIGGCWLQMQTAVGHRTKDEVGVRKM